MRTLHSRIDAGLIVLLAGVACSEPTAPGPPLLVVQVVTDGDDLPLEPYGVRVDDLTLVDTKPVLGSGTAVFPDLSPGVVLVELTDVPANCEVEPPNSHLVRLEPELQVDVSFTVHCLASGVKVVTTLSGLDPPAYRVHVDGQDRGALVVGEPLTASRLDPGEHVVELVGEAANCTVAGGTSRTVFVRLREVTPVAYDLDCVARYGSVTVTVSTSGVDRDPDGYSLQVENLDWQPVASNGTRTLDGVLPGDQQILLGGLAGNCTIQGGQPPTVTVTAGGFTRDTVRAAIDVTCGSAGDIAFARGGAIAGTDLSGAVRAGLIPGEEPAWSPDGTRLAFTCDSVVCLWTVDVDVKRLPSPYTDEAPAWHPDGNRVAVSSWNCSADYYDYWFYCAWAGIFVVWVDGTRTAILLPQTVVTGGHPTWSPDGTQLAFSCQIGVEPAQICVVTVGESIVRRIATSVGAKGRPAWSPDGSRIAFDADVGPTREIMLVDPDGTDLVRLAPGIAGEGPSWSRDGTRILFATPCSAGGCIGGGLFVIGADGSGLTRVTTGPDRAPSWRR